MQKDTPNANTSYLYYHNPKCSKSREGLLLIQKKNKKVTLTIKKYLDEGLTHNELNTIINRLAHPMSELIRDKDARTKQIPIPNTFTKANIIDILKKYPQLLQRPILVGPKTALIGRPPEHLTSLFDESN